MRDPRGDAPDQREPVGTTRTRDHAGAVRVGDRAFEGRDARRLRHEAIRARLEAAAALLDRVIGREHDDRRRDDAAAGRDDQVRGMVIAEVVVGDDHIGRVFPQRVERGVKASDRTDDDDLR